MKLDEARPRKIGLMNDPAPGAGLTSTQAPTHTESAAWNRLPEQLRILGLTVLYHPDLQRVGDRTLLEGVEAGRQDEVSRHAPVFAPPGASSSPRPLEDGRLSRTPIVLRGDGDGVTIDRASSSTALMVDGEQIEKQVTIPREALQAGVVLLLAGRIVLLLHRLDPVADHGTPRFGLVGDSPAMAQIRRDIVQTADLQVPILLRGESGTGKELVARAIHDAGPRRNGPYVAVNMAALPPSLAAAELFGAERGAYTGADRRRAGYFEQAHGGTLFLDEVGETPPAVQALLLRTLETGEVRPVGGSRVLTPDVRILSATDADLEGAIEKERFRAPLLHRLSGYVLRLPPLHQRREDFGRLFLHFLRRELEAVGQAHRLSPRPRLWLPALLIGHLAAWSWPGNVRQLANAARQLVIANRHADPANRFEEMETLLASADGGRAATRHAQRPRDEPLPAPRSASAPPRVQAGDLQEEQVVAALRAHDFRPAAAADALGIPRSSIYDLIKRIPGLRQASELTREQIDEVRERVGPSLEAMAAALEVSQRALKRRMGQLDATGRKGS